MLVMESEEWEMYPSYIGSQVVQYRPISEDDDDDWNGDVVMSLDVILLGDLLENVLSFLPVVSIIRSGCVCKMWHEIVQSQRWAWSKMVPQKSEYFLFTCSEKAVSDFVCDPSFRKCCNIHDSSVGQKLGFKCNTSDKNLTMCLL
jgi:hypothetical protein